VDQPRQANAPSRRLTLQGSIVDACARSGEPETSRRVVGETGVSPGPELAFWEGGWDRLEAGWSRTRHTAAAGLDRSNEARADCWLARLWRLRGDTAGAIAALSAALAIGLDGPSLLIQLKASAELASVMAGAGRTDEAELHLVRCREILGMGEDWRGLAGRVALAEAVTAGLAGCIQDAEAHFARAIATFQRFSLPLDEAEALTLRGQVYAHAGRSHRHAAAESFEKAVDVYSGHGAGQPWIDHVLALQLRALGGRNGALATAYPDGLSGREAEVLRLIASGLSSKEIGGALVLSVRTVERHIANVYIKTNTHGRAQATAYALSHGLGPQTR